MSVIIPQNEERRAIGRPSGMRERDVVVGEVPWDNAGNFRVTVYY